MGNEMLLAHATCDVETMTDEEVLHYVDSQVVLTRDLLLTMNDYRKKAVELMVEAA